MTNFQDKYAELNEFDTPVKSGDIPFIVRTVIGDTVAVDSAENNIFKDIITTIDIDRYGDIVEAQGMDSVDFIKNPMVLFNHISGADLLPIGRSLALESSPKDVMSDTEVHGQTDLSLDVLKLRRLGYLKGTSIGFMPTEWENMPAEKGAWCEPRRYTKWKLLEYSIVNIPANPNALSASYNHIIDIKKALDANVISSESALVKYVYKSIEKGVAPEVRKSIESTLIQRFTIPNLRTETKSIPVFSHRIIPHKKLNIQLSAGLQL